MSLAPVPNTPVLADRTDARRTTLADAVARHGRLSTGQAVGVGIAVAQELAALHERGRWCGALSPWTIDVAHDRVTLAPMGRAVPTPGFAPPDPPSPSSDIYALGAVLRWCATPGDERILAWTEPMLASAPEARCSATVVLGALPECAAPEPLPGSVSPGAGGVDDQSSSAESAPEAGTTAGDARIAARVRERAWLSQTLGTPIRAGRSWRALLLGALLTAVVVSVGAAWLVSTVVSTDAPGLADPAQAAVELTEQRFAALASAHAADLAQTVQEGSPAAAALDVQRQELVAGELGYEGLEVSVVAAEVVEHQDSEATVVIDYTVSAHVIRKGDIVTSVPEYRQVVELSLSAADGRWRVTNARAAP